MTVAELLARHSDEVVGVFERLRELVRRSMPEAEERVYPGWRALGFRDAEGGYVCGLFPFDDHVRLLFERGARLYDPRGRLEGTDRKQVRWIDVRPGAEVPAAEIAKFLAEALLLGRLRPAALIRPPRRRRRR